MTDQALAAFNRPDFYKKLAEEYQWPPQVVADIPLVSLYAVWGRLGSNKRPVSGKELSARLAAIRAKKKAQGA